MTKTPNKNSEIEKVLEKPVIDSLSENSHRVRRNLIIFSAIAVMYIKFDAKFSSDIQTPLTVLKGIDDLEIMLALLCIIIYHFLHFSFIAIEHLYLLKVRTTKADFKIRNMDDYLNNSWQSTLYSWWSNGVREIEDKFKESKVEALEKLLKVEVMISNSTSNE